MTGEIAGRAARSPAVSAPREGDVLGGYQLVETLGEGAHGFVYRAARDGQDVALKILKPDVAAADPGIRRRFIAEGELLQKLRHPNIVAFVEYFEADRKHCIVTEFVNGGSIDDLIDGKRLLPEEECVRIVAQVLDALAFIHPHGVFHRDIKPSNILIDFRRIPRISDFGIAKMLDRHQTAANVRIGTREYMAPEMFRTGQVDERTDVYAAGVTLYEMLTARRPIEPSPKDRDVFEYMKRVMREAPVPASRHRPVTPALEAIVMKAIAKNPEERWQSAGAFRDALLAVVSALGRDAAGAAAGSLADDAKAARIARAERHSSTVEEPAAPTLHLPVAFVVLGGLVMGAGVLGFVLGPGRMPIPILGERWAAIAVLALGLGLDGVGTYLLLARLGRLPWQRAAESPFHAYLVLGRAPGRVVPIMKPVLRIGRDAKNDLEVMDPRVSRFHGEIVFHSGALHFRDLGSTNGSQHNQRPLAAGESAQLRPNDQLLVGGTAIRVVFAERPPRIAAA